MPPTWPDQAPEVLRERARRVRVAFFDIDGTLQPLHDGPMPESAIAALEHLGELGVRRVVCTGRDLDYAREIERFARFDGWLCANGSYCVLDGELIRAEALDGRDVRSIVERAAEGEFPVALTYDDTVAVGVAAGCALGDDYWPGKPRRAPEELDLARPVYQLNIVVGPGHDDEILAATPHLRSARWTERFMDVVPADGGKQAGMEAVLARLSTTREQCLAFGDGGNDLEMLAYAGVGVAMGNGAPQVRAAADYVTSAVDDDGIECALVALGLA